MFLKSLDLNNFGIVENASLNFGKGFNLLMGNTGNGKSTALKALAYLLVNFTPKKIEDFLNWNKDDFSARLTFDHETLPFDYETKFFRAGDKSERELHVGGDKPYFASDATKKMAEFFDPILCKAALISFQNESDLVTLDPAKRRDLLKKIYDLNFQSQIDLIKQEVDNLTKKAAETDTGITIARTRIMGYKTEAILSLPFEKLDYELKQGLLLKLNNEVAFINNAIKEWNSIKLSIHEKQLAINGYQANRKTADATVLQAEAQIKQYTDTLAADSFYGKRDKLQVDLTQDFEKTKRELEVQLAGIVLSRVPKFNEPELEEKQNYLNELNRQITNVEEKITTCKDGKCPICGKDYPTGELEADEKQLEIFRESYSSINQQIKELKELKLNIQKQKEEQITLVLKKENIQGKIENEVRMIAQKKLLITSQIEAEEKNIEHLKEAIKLRINVETEKLNAAVAKQRAIDVSIEEKEKEIRELEVKLPETEPSLDENIQMQIIILNEEIESFKRVVIQNEQIEIRNALAEKNKKDDEEKLSKLIALKTSIATDIDNYKEASTIYKVQFPNFIISDMISDIEKGVNSFLDKAYEGRYHVTIKESKTGLSIVYGPREKDISLASGGEVDLFNIGLKVAFCKLSGMRILILDEVDKYFDDDVAINTFTIIDGMIRDGEFEQVFVISHKGEVKDVVEQFGAKVFEFRKGVVTSY